MTTKNPRINVTIEPDIYKNLNILSQQKGLSMSLLTRDLIKEALELYEDVYFDKEASNRAETFAYSKALSHEDIWK